MPKWLPALLIATATLGLSGYDCTDPESVSEAPPIEEMEAHDREEVRQEVEKDLSEAAREEGLGGAQP